MGVAKKDAAASTGRVRKHPPQLRARALRMYAKGMRVNEIARKLNVSSGAVYWWVNPQPRMRMRRSDYQMVDVDCSRCGKSYRAKWGSVQKARRNGTKNVCPECLEAGANKEVPRIRVTRELKQWWRDRYTPEQIQELAGGLTAWLD